MMTANGRQGVVLVVDDSPEYLDLLGSALSAQHHVRIANSGRRALELAAVLPRPDVVLLGVLMPEMDGHEVLARLRADPATRDIPVIVVTSVAAAGEELASLEQGACDFIAKPASPLVVRARVRAQLELKQAREALQEGNRALRSVVEELEAFTYSVSHDLRAPLATVSGFAQALIEGERGLSETGRRRLERLHQGAVTMHRMIDDILACSRAERVELHRSNVGVRALVQDVVSGLCEVYPRGEVVIGDLPAVQGDSTLLRQAFANLIGNALKFSSQVESPRVEVQAVPVADGMVEFRVQDNGAGFDEAYAGKLFGLFQRLHTQSEFPGTGVGLAIVKRVVSRHGGSVRAESVPGRTTFAITLPASADVTNEAPVAA